MLLCLKEVCLPAASTTICLLQQKVCVTFVGDWDAKFQLTTDVWLAADV